MELFYLFSHLLYPNCSFSSLPSLPNSPHPTLFSPPLRKEQALPGTLAKYGITSYNKTRHIFSKQSWMRQPSGNKRVPKEAKESETAQLPLYACMRTTQVRAIQGPWCLWVHLMLSQLVLWFSVVTVSLIPLAPPILPFLWVTEGGWFCSVSPIARSLCWCHPHRLHGISNALGFYLDLKMLCVLYLLTPDKIWN